MHCFGLRGWNDESSILKSGYAQSRLELLALHILQQYASILVAAQCVRSRMPDEKYGYNQSAASLGNQYLSVSELDGLVSGGEKLTYVLKNFEITSL